MPGSASSARPFGYGGAASAEASGPATLGHVIAAECESQSTLDPPGDVG